jgi:hypothetical protein
MMEVGPNVHKKLKFTASSIYVLLTEELREQVTYPYKTVDKLILLIMLIFKLSETGWEKGF